MLLLSLFLSLLFGLHFSTIINYWFKILESEPIKYIKYAYNLMRTSVENKPDCVNWASKLRDLMSNLGFYEV